MRQPKKDHQRPAQQYSSSRSVSSQQGPAAMYDQLQRYNTAPPVVYYVQQPTRRNDTVHSVVNSVIEGLIEGGANQLGQALIQGAMGN